MSRRYSRSKGILEGNACGGYGDGQWDGPPPSGRRRRKPLNGRGRLCVAEEWARAGAGRWGAAAPSSNSRRHSSVGGVRVRCALPSLRGNGGILRLRPLRGMGAVRRGRVKRRCHDENKRKRGRVLIDTEGRACQLCRSAKTFDEMLQMQWLFVEMECPRRHAKKRQQSKKRAQFR